MAQNVEMARCDVSLLHYSKVRHIEFTDCYYRNMVVRVHACDVCKAKYLKMVFRVLTRGIFN